MIITFRNSITYSYNHFEALLDKPDHSTFKSRMKGENEDVHVDESVETSHATHDIWSSRHARCIQAMPCLPLLTLPHSLSGTVCCYLDSQ